jgi:hypothetical protein
MFYKTIFADLSVPAFLYCIFKNVLVISKSSSIVNTNVY